MKNRTFDQHVAELKREGYTIVPDVMSPSEIEATRRAIDETLAREEELGRKLGIQSNDLKMVFEAHGKHPHFHGLVLRNPEPLEISRRILGEDLVCYNLTIRVPMPSGQKDTAKYGGHLHVDWDAYTVVPFVGGGSVLRFDHAPSGAHHCGSARGFRDPLGFCVVAHGWG